MTKARDISKLSAVEADATADQTNAEVKAAVEAASDSNTFTDADHSKLNAIEASADVTDTANVTSSGALMDSELTNLAAVKAINQSLVTTASPTFSAVTATGVTVGNSSIGSNTSHLANLTINNNSHIGSANATNAIQIATSGAVTFGGSVTATNAILSDGVTDAGSAGSATTFNNGSTTADFRVKSSGNANMFVVDGGANAVGIGTSTPGSYYAGAEQLVVAKAAGDAGITIATSTSANGALYFADGTSGSTAYQGGIAYNHSTDKLVLVESGAGNIFFGPTEYVFNETSLDRDFRVESNTGTHALFVQGSDGNVGIGTSSPSDKLLVKGDAASISVESADMQIALLGKRASSGVGLDQGYLRLRNQGVTANGAVIDSAGNSFFNGGNVGIGTSSPTHKLEIRNDVGASADLDPTAIKLYNNSDGGSAIEFSNAVSGKSKISFGVTSTGSGTDDTYLGFSTGANTALSERMRITSDGKINVVGNSPAGIYFENNNTRIYHGGHRLLEGSTSSTAVVTLAEGYTGYLYCEPTIKAKRGISFGTDTATANQLDDYEEGTWTASMTDTGGSALTMVARTCRYTKIGRKVHIYGVLQTTSLASASGNLRVHGLPFSSASDWNDTAGVHISLGSGLNITAGETLTGWVHPNSQYFNLQIWNSAAGTNYMTTGEWSADGQVFFNGHYSVS